LKNSEYSLLAGDMRQGVYDV